jgi:hypothetical protein
MRPLTGDKGAEDQQGGMGQQVKHPGESMHAILPIDVGALRPSLRRSASKPPPTYRSPS